jgi:hypothetical protein
VSSATALRLSLVALVLSILCFAVNGAINWFHAPIPLPQQVVTFLGVFGLTWPLWAYAVALYRRALAAKR